MFLASTIIATLISLGITAIVVFGNAQSAPTAPFKGAWLILLPWCFTAVLWLAWATG